jgi:hypothetical protein
LNLTLLEYSIEIIDPRNLNSNNEVNKIYSKNEILIKVSEKIVMTAKEKYEKKILKLSNVLIHKIYY